MQSHRLQAGEDDDFAVRTQEELISTFNSTSQLLTVLLAVIAGISLTVGYRHYEYDVRISY